MTPAGSTGAADPLDQCDEGSPALGAFDLLTGELQWTSCTTVEAWREVLGATEDAVFVASTMPDGAHVVTAIDAVDGAPRWELPVQPGMGWPPGPFAGGGVVVLSAADGGAAVIGVDASTGAERWRVDGLAGPLANTDDTVIVAGAGLSALDRASGAERWHVDVVLQDESGVGVARAATAVSGDTLIVPAGPEVIAIDADSGAEVWRVEAVHHPTALGGHVVGFVGGGPEQIVRALDAVTGQALWSAPGAPSYGDLWALGEDMVAVLDPASGGIVAYDLPTGAVRWRRDDFVGQPLRAAGDAVVNLWGGLLTVVSTSDGSTRWSHQALLGSEWMSSLVPNSSTVFVAVNTLPFGD